jgi:hypothetical protein
MIYTSLCLNDSGTGRVRLPGSATMTECARINCIVIYVRHFLVGNLNRSRDHDDSRGLNPAYHVGKSENTVEDTSEQILLRILFRIHTYC